MSKHKHHRAAKNRNKYVERFKISARKAIEKLNKHIQLFPKYIKNAEDKLEYVRNTGKTKGRHIRVIF